MSSCCKVMRPLDFGLAMVRSFGFPLLFVSQLAIDLDVANALFIFVCVLCESSQSVFSRQRCGDSGFDNARISFLAGDFPHAQASC